MHLQGEIADMDTLGIWEPYRVKIQTVKTAIEVCNAMTVVICLDVSCA